MLGFQLLNGLTFAALLFVVASGFTLVFGLLRIVNLAHGALYLLGGYVAYEVGGRSGSFALSVVAAMVAVALAGLALDRGLLRFVKGQDLRQVLLTVGVGLVLNDLFLVIWGGDAFTVPTPEALQGAAVVMGVFYPKYRLFVLLAGVAIFVLLWLVMNRTRYGALIRAGVDDAEMLSATGVDQGRLFVITFMLGSALAGLGGALGAEVLGLDPTFPLKFMVYFLIVVAVGGTSSITGPLLAALLLGVADVAGKYYVPKLGAFIVYSLMLVILLWRPQGLFVRKGGK